jgi:hypothetical protein
MPFEVALPAAAKKAGWKVKIRDRERLEPPHVTILFKTEAWRVGLRDEELLVPPGGSWSALPPEVRQAIEAHWDELIAAWDAMYPENPVEGTGDE